ncbi:MAG: hypothetical protein PVI01_00215 [Gemmatimonadales bacterium]|jgi:hypothetical protein
MWLRLLVPLTLLWPILALTVEGTSLNRYRATPGRELLALAFCILGYFALWVLLDRVMEPLTGRDAPGLIVATVLSLAAVPGCLFLGFKIFGVSAGGAENQH